MKRSPIRRKTPLRTQGGTLERTAGLARGFGPLIRKAPPRRHESFAARVAREAWHTVPYDAPCVACREPVKGAPPHHAVPKQVLKHVAKLRGIPAWVLLWDVRVRVVLCRACHANHENASPRLARRCLSNANLTFAEDIDCAVYTGSRFYT